jgi:hypothetical protein
MIFRRDKPGVSDRFIAVVAGARYPPSSTDNRRKWKRQALLLARLVRAARPQILHALREQHHQSKAADGDHKAGSDRRQLVHFDIRQEEGQPAQHERANFLAVFKTAPNDPHQSMKAILFAK